jgi:hypothetical protein
MADSQLARIDCKRLEPHRPSELEDKRCSQPARRYVAYGRDSTPQDCCEALSAESGCMTLQLPVLGIRVTCKDLWKLLHDIYTSVLTEWNYENNSYKPYLTTREMPRITLRV